MRRAAGGRVLRERPLDLFADDAADVLFALPVRVPARWVSCVMGSSPSLACGACCEDGRVRHSALVRQCAATSPNTGSSARCAARRQSCRVVREPAEGGGGVLLDERAQDEGAARPSAGRVADRRAPRARSCAGEIRPLRAGREQRADERLSCRRPGAGGTCRAQVQRRSPAVPDLAASARSASVEQPGPGGVEAGRDVVTAWV